jgi:HAD superfamily hydrolase (TIGR01484 family)
MSEPRLLLCTDLDRTLLPNGTAPESPGARRGFAALAAHDGVVPVYVTGRDRDLVQEAVARYGIPQPGFVISDVGTRIYDLREGQWQRWTAWEDAISGDWGGRRHETVQALLGDLSVLRLQEPGKQNDYKVSYYVALGTDHRVLCRDVAKRLEDAGVRAALVWSVDEPAGVGLLDVLPASAGKLEAIRFLQSRLGFAKDEVLFAGDSGNDLPVLASALPSVLVANASEEVRSEAVALAVQQGTRDLLYLARGGWLGMNGNYGAGILEGVAHFHPDLLESKDGDQGGRHAV